MVRALVEELTPEATDPGELLAHLNHDLRSILKQSGTPLFTTAFYLVADLETNRAFYANAGHPKPIVLRGSGGVEVLQNPGNKSNPALGLFDRFKYPTASVPLSALDRFVLFTDGVYDVEKDGELLSPEWLSSELLKRRDLPFGTMFDQILAELKTYCGDQEFCDDMCLLGMEVAG